MGISKVIFGIDPGFDRVGWAALKLTDRSFELLDYGCIQTDKTQPIFDRYAQIISEIRTLIDLHQPAQLGIETIFFSKNTTTAIRVSEARGVILSAFVDRQIPIVELNPSSIKLTVSGNGRATKAQLEKMVKLQVKFPDNNTLIDDAIDAVAIAMTAGLTAN